MGLSSKVMTASLAKALFHLLGARRMVVRHT
jgi:hypothetical protein